MAALLESPTAANGRLGARTSLTVAVVAACPFPAPRGTPIRILRLSEALAARGHRVHVVTYADGHGETSPLLSLHRIRTGTKRTMVPGPSYRKLAFLDPLLGVKLARLLRRERVDIIHAHHYEGLLVAAAARAGTGIDTPLVYDAHTMLGSELPSYAIGLPTGVKRFIAERCDRALPGWSDHTMSVTERIRAKLVASGALPAERVTVVPNGVELERFAPPASAGPATALRDGARTLIFTGNLAPYQGIDFLLGAFRRIRERRDDVRLLVVAGSSLEGYEPLARALGIRDAIDVLPADFSRIPELLARADIAVNPRIDCDGIPLKLLNYLAAAKPVLSFESAAPGLQHGDTAWLAADGDVGAFANGALALLDNPSLSERLGRNGRGFVEANHSWDRSAARAEAVFADLLAGVQRRRRAGGP